MLKAYKDFWANAFDFKGRISRSGYWWVFLINFIINMIGVYMVNSQSFGKTIITIYAILAFIPTWSLTVRRLYDTDRSGWNLLWIFIPVLGWIILLVCLASNYNDGVPKSLLR